MKNKIYYTITDYTQLSLRSLDFFTELREKGYQIVIVVPYRFDWFLLALIPLFYLFKRKLYQKLFIRYGHYKEAKSLSDKIQSWSSIRFIIYFLNRFFQSKGPTYNILKAVLEKNLVSRLHIRDQDIAYGLDGSSLVLFKKANKSKAKRILESQAVHIDLALDIKDELYGKANPIDYRNKWWYEKQRKEVELADHIIAYSEFQKKSILIKTDKENDDITIVPLSSRYPKKKETKLVSEMKIEFLFVGSIGKRKGVDLLVDVWQSIPGNCNLHLAGSKADITLDHLPDHVYYHGYQYSTELQKLFEKCHVFVFPTFNDSYGLVVMEALSYNMPVITTSNCGASVMIENGKTGLIYDNPFDKEALRANIRKFIDFPELIIEFSKNIAENQLYGREEEVFAGRQALKKIGLL